MSNTVNNKKTGMKHGIYKIFWKSGGMSLASVGSTHDGANWYAPCNWTSEDNKRPYVASTDWSDIEKVELIIEHNYDPNDDGQPEQPISEEGKLPTRDARENDAQYFLRVQKYQYALKCGCDRCKEIITEQSAPSPSQEAIEFAEWIQIENWRWTATWGWSNEGSGDVFYKTNELYQLYTEHKNSKP